MSPTFTLTSITNTLSPPTSGSFTSVIDVVCFVATFSSTLVGATGVSAFSTCTFSTSLVSAFCVSEESADFKVQIIIPSEILSPAFTDRDSIVPAVGAGISIEAFSVSTTIIASSASILSPTFTLTSIINTLSPPTSGSFTSSILIFSPYAYNGLILFGLILNLAIASFNTFLSILPFSTNKYRVV